MHHGNKIIPITNRIVMTSIISYVAVPSLHTGLINTVHEHSVYAKSLHVTTNLTFSTLVHMLYLVAENMYTATV